MSDPGTSETVYFFTVLYISAPIAATNATFATTANKTPSRSAIEGVHLMSLPQHGALLIPAFI
jgi:hypothetical protein